MTSPESRRRSGNENGGRLKTRLGAETHAKALAGRRWRRVDTADALDEFGYEPEPA